MNKTPWLVIFIFLMVFLFLQLKIIISADVYKVNKHVKSADGAATDLELQADLKVKDEQRENPINDKDMTLKLQSSKGIRERPFEEAKLEKEKGIATVIEDKDLGLVIELDIFRNSITFPKWCNEYQRHNCSFTEYIDKHQVKQHLPQVAPALNFAEEYAYVSSPDEITEELVAKLPHKYFMKLNNFAMSKDMIEVEGGKVNCMKSGLCERNQEDYQHRLATFLRMLCADFLNTVRIYFEKPRKKINCFSLIPPKCIFEEEFRIADKFGISDYKVFVFHGRPMFILIMNDRDINQVKMNFVTTSWVEINMTLDIYLKSHGKTWLPEKPPPFFKQLVEYSAQIGGLFKHARVDFFVYGDKFSFAEIQQSSTGCDFKLIPSIADNFYGYLLENPDVTLPSDYILRLTNQTF